MRSLRKEDHFARRLREYKDANYGILESVALRSVLMNQESATAEEIESMIDIIANKYLSFHLIREKEVFFSFPSQLSFAYSGENYERFKDENYPVVERMALRIALKEKGKVTAQLLEDVSNRITQRYGAFRILRGYT